MSLGHVPALLPYISDSGVLIPERSIFSQLINLAVIVQLITFYIRFNQEQQQIPLLLLRLRLQLSHFFGTAKACLDSSINMIYENNGKIIDDLFGKPLINLFPLFL